MNPNDNSTARTFLMGVRTALQQGASHDDILNEIGKQNPNLADGISQGRATGASSLQILQEMTKQASNRLNNPAGTPEAQPEPNTLQKFAGSIISPIANMIAKPGQAISAIANPDTQATQGGQIRPLGIPIDINDVSGNQSASSIIKQGVGQAAQTVAVGLGPIAGGATYGAGAGLENAKDSSALSTAGQVAQGAALGAAGGKVLGVVGGLAGKAAGKIGGKLAPVAQNISEKIGLENYAPKIASKISSVASKEDNKIIQNSFKPDLSSATKSEVSKAIKGKVPGVVVQQAGSKNIATLNKTGLESVKTVTSHLNEIGISPKELSENPAGASQKIRDFANKKYDELAQKLGGDTVKHDTSFLSDKFSSKEVPGQATPQKGYVNAPPDNPIYPEKPIKTEYPTKPVEPTLGEKPKPGDTQATREYTQKIMNFDSQTEKYNKDIEAWNKQKSNIDNRYNANIESWKKQKFSIDRKYDSAISQWSNAENKSKAAFEQAKSSFMPKTFHPIENQIYGKGIVKTNESDELIKFVSEKVHPNMTSGEISSLQTSLNKKAEKLAPNVYTLDSASAKVKTSVSDTAREIRDMLYNQLESIEKSSGVKTKDSVKAAKQLQTRLYNASDILRSRASISGGKATLGQKILTGSKHVVKKTLPSTGIIGGAIGGYELSKKL